jgi:hypothetical protein
MTEAEESLTSTLLPLENDAEDNIALEFLVSINLLSREGWTTLTLGY